MEVIGPDISQYDVVVLNDEPGCVVGLVEKPDADKAPLNLACISCYLLTPDIFDLLRNHHAGAGGEIQLADAINTHTAYKLVEAVTLAGRRFYCCVDAMMYGTDRRAF